MVATAKESKSQPVRLGLQKGEKPLNAMLEEMFFLILEECLQTRSEPNKPLRRIVQLMKAQGMNPKAILQARRLEFPYIDQRLRDFNVDHNWSES